MITRVIGIDIRFQPGVWPAPGELRAQVPAIWARLKTRTPQLWDGRILGISGPGGGPPVVVDGVLFGEAREDSYSAFLAWRDLGFPEIGVRNLFGSAIIVSADGAIILGQMAADTANGGMIYPPGGSLEPGDVGMDGRVDVVGSIVRELHEETGLSAGEARVGGTWALFDGPRISVARFHHFLQPADELVAQIRRNLAGQAHRELADVVAVRRAEEVPVDRTMPYVLDLLAAFGRGEVN